MKKYTHINTYCHFSLELMRISMFFELTHELTNIPALSGVGRLNMYSVSL